MAFAWKTQLVSRFPCSLPLIGAPMAGVSGGLLAAETCRAGALGFIAAGHLQNVNDLEKQISLFRDSQNEHGREYPLCLGFISHSSLKSIDGWKRFEQVLERHQPDVVQFFAPAIVENTHDTSLGAAKTNIQLAQAYNALAIAQVGSYREAQESLDAGVDGLIVQGSEAGGHGLRRELGCGTLSLATTVSSLAKSYNVPVVAAGGIVDGRGVAAALAMGCDGAVLGTRLWASQEAMSSNVLFKQCLVDAESCDDVVRTTVFDQIQNSYTSTPWPEPFDSMGALRNDMTRQWDRHSMDELAKTIIQGDVVHKLQQAQSAGDNNIAYVLSGEGVGNIKSIEPAYDILIGIERETRETIQQLINVAPALQK